jgi:hypothetical protein
VYAAALTQAVALGAGRTTDLRVGGRWSLTPIPGTSIVEARLDDPTVEGAAAPQVSRDELRRPVLLVHDAGGRFTGLRFAPGTSAGTRRLLTGLATATQYTPGEGARWAVDEDDGAGTFPASYRREGAVVRRSMQSYRTLIRGADPSHVRLEGEARITLGIDGEPAAIEARASTRFTPGEKVPAIAGTCTAALTLRDRFDVLAAELDAARARVDEYDPVELGPRENDEETERAIDESRAAGATLPQLRRAFLDAGGDAKSRERAELVGRASAALRLDPAQALEAGRALGARGVSVEEAGFLAASLAGARTEEASTALADALLSPEATKDARFRAAIGLAQTTVADAHTVEALKSAATSDDPDLRSTATLALGAQGRALGGDPAGADPVADLLAQYGAAIDDESRALLLKALGNSGDPRALAVIRAALESPALGAPAAYSLRFIPGGEVDALLHQLVTGAADPGVRRAACAAARYRDAALWAPWLESALAVETDPQVKATLESALHRAPSQKP